LADNIVYLKLKDEVNRTKGEREMANRIFNWKIKGDKDNDFLIQGYKEWVRTTTFYIAKTAGIKTLKIKFGTTGNSFCSADKSYISLGVNVLKKLWLGTHIIIHELAHVLASKRAMHNKIWQNIDYNLHEIFNLKTTYLKTPGYEKTVEIIQEANHV